MDHHEIEGLLGAYALDAVDAEEERAITAHLGECPRCRAEVASHREVVALLSHGGDAPAGVWERIAGSLEEAPPPIAMDRFRRPHQPARSPSGSTSRGLSTRGVALLSAAAVVVIALLTAQVVSQNRRIERLAGQAALSGIDDAIVSAASDPDARTIELASADGALTAKVLVLRSRGYVVGGNLPALDQGRTYQLWAKSGNVLLSVGVLGPRLERMGFALGGEPELLAITAEDAPGVLSSNNPPVVVGAVPSRSA